MTKINELRFISDDGNRIIIGEAERIFEREPMFIPEFLPKRGPVSLFEGRQYQRSTDGAIMTERSPNCFVNTKIRS